MYLTYDVSYYVTGGVYNKNIWNPFSYDSRMLSDSKTKYVQAEKNLALGMANLLNIFMVETHMTFIHEECVWHQYFLHYTIIINYI